MSSPEQQTAILGGTGAAVAAGIVTIDRVATNHSGLASAAKSIHRADSAFVGSYDAVDISPSFSLSLAISSARQFRL
jgi:hypothetical protein